MNLIDKAEANLLVAALLGALLGTMLSVIFFLFIGV
jgi:hypothetical protein